MALDGNLSDVMLDDPPKKADIPGYLQWQNPGKGESAPVDPTAGITGRGEQARIDLTDLTRKHIAKTEGIERETEGRLEGDRARQLAAYNAESVGPDKLQPWDFEKKRQEFYTNPIEAFGSLASVFAIAASAFTHAPMENALNASAAAMNAIKANDDKGYEQAYGAWKDNMDLVKKRFDMQHALYSDAMNLMKTDLSAGEYKLANAARQFGDQKTLALLEAGMYPELAQLMSSELKNMEEMQKVRENFNASTIRDNFFKAAEKQNNPNGDPFTTFQNFNTSQGLVKPWQQELMQQAILESRGKPDQKEIALDFAKRIRDADTKTSLGADDEEHVKRRAQELMQQGMQPSEAYLKARHELVEATTKPGAAGGNANLTASRQQADDVRKARERWKAEGKSDEEIAHLAAQMTNRLKSESTPITSNRKDDIDRNITRHAIASETIDDIERLLKTKFGVAGLGGMLGRKAEVMSNWFGSDEASRKQFETWINELRQLEPRLANESNSRPLAAEERQIASIVPGLAMGDTTVNTAKRLLELQKLFRKMNTDLIRRREGKFDPETAGGKGALLSGNTPAWKRAPLE